MEVIMKNTEEKSLYENMIDVLGNGDANVRIKRLKIKRAMRLEGFVFGSSSKVGGKVRECLSMLDNMNIKNSMVWWCNSVSLEDLNDSEITEVKGFFSKYGFPVVIDKQKHIKIMR
jgi:hypothetical protein